MEMCTKNSRQTNDANQRKQNIAKLHLNIRNENIKKVEENLQIYIFDDHAYNDAGQSAVATSLEVFNLDIYELLVTNGFRLGPHEDIKKIVDESFKQKQIFDIHRKCAIESKKEYLTVLRSKCRLHVDTPENKKEEYFHAIMTALEKLDESASEISALLKVLALCAELKIIFDFNKTSTDAIDPRETEQTNGICYFTFFCIGIGAKNLLDDEKSSEVLGTMAHEFCHCAMYLMFKNRCKPYEEIDEKSKSKFEKIVSDYKKRFNRDQIGEEIVNLVYECYGENVWHAELIVRVPHMLAHYKGNDDKLKQLRDNFSDLFEFYEELMPKTKKNMEEMKVKFEVKEINELCGVLLKLQTTKFNFKDDAIDNFKIDMEFSNPQFYKSNCVTFTMKTIFEKAMRLEKNNFFIFAEIQSLKIDKIAKKIFTALESYNEVVVIVNCDELEHDKFQFHIIDEVCKKVTKNQKMVFVVNEKLKIAAIKCKKMNHLWTELTQESQKKLLKVKVNFQGSKLKLNEIWSKNIKTVPFDELSKGKEIQIGQEIKCEGIHVERNFLAFNAAWDNDEQKYDKEPVTIDEIIKEIDDSKVVVLSDAPGNGKSTEFKFVTFKLKEIFRNRWILLLDLKMHTKNFKNDKDNSTCFDSIEKITNYLADKILKLKNFEREIFFELFKNNRVVVLMDGVDEISPSYKNFVINLADGIKKMSQNQLWIATRPHLAKELEETLDTKAWRLTKFSKEDQMSVFEKIFTKHNLFFVEFSEKVKRFLNEIETEILNDKNEVTNPLFLHMIAELFIENQDFQLQNSSLFKIYDKFVTKMFRRLLTKGEEAENDTVEFMKDIQIQEFHKKTAVEMKIVKIRLNYLFQNVFKPSDDQLTRIGLIYNVGDDYFFIHETFKEFFIAQIIFEKIFKLKFNSKDELNEIIGVFIVILEDEDCSMIMKFLDDALENFETDQNREKSKILIEILEQNLSGSNLSYDKINIFRRAAEYGCNNLLIFLTKLPNQNVMRVWLECNKVYFIGQNVLMIVFRQQTHEKIKKLWSFSDEFFTEDQIKELLTYKPEIYDNANNCFNFAIRNKDEKSFEFFLELAEQKLNSSEKETLIDCKSLKWSFISSYGNVGNILSRIKKFLTPQYKDSLKYFTDHVHFNKACQYQCVESIKFICHEITDIYGSEKFKYVLQRKTLKKETVLMSALLNWGNLEVFETLINFIETDDEVRKMLRQESIEGRNVLMEACCSHNKTEAISKVLKTYEKYFDMEELRKIFVREDIREKNILDNATVHFTHLTLVWSFMQKVFDNESLKKLLIKSLKYIQSFEVHKFMPFIFQTLTSDEYSLIFPQWLEAAKYSDDSECKNLFNSVDAEKEYAKLFYEKLFNFQDENNETIIDCAKQNENAKVLELFNEKKN